MNVPEIISWGFVMDSGILVEVEGWDVSHQNSVWLSLVLKRLQEADQGGALKAEVTDRQLC